MNFLEIMGLIGLIVIGLFIIGFIKEYGHLVKEKFNSYLDKLKIKK